MFKYFILFIFVSTCLLQGCGKPYKKTFPKRKYTPPKTDYDSWFSDTPKKTSLEDDYKRDAELFKKAEEDIIKAGYSIKITKFKKRDSYNGSEYIEKWDLNIPNKRDKHAVNALTKLLEITENLLGYKTKLYFINKEVKELFQKLNSLKISLETEIKRLNTISPFDEFKENFCSNVKTLNFLLKETSFKHKKTIDSECIEASDYKALKKIGFKLSRFAHPDKHVSNNITDSELATKIKKAFAPLLSMIQEINNLGK